MARSFTLRKKPDIWIPVIGIGLSLFGLVMILSASQVIASEKFNDQYYFFTKQLISWVIGMAVYFYMTRVSLEDLFEKRSILLLISILLLFIVFIPGIGGSTSGVYRWIYLGPITFQPSDLTKLALLIFLSAMLAVKGENVRQVSRGLIPFMTVTVGVVGSILLGKDLDTAVAISVMALALFFCANSKFSHTLMMITVALLAVVGLILSTPYRVERVKVLLNGGGNNETTAYHAKQAQIAIGTGGLWGAGFGSGISKYSYLPESYTDSIFAVIAEELGFVRTSLIILAYLFLGWRIYLVALQANSKFVELLAIGGGTLIITQAFVNIGGMLGILPISGLTLPFISSGGSSLIVFLALLGLLTNISRERTV